jgi:type IV pilus assembly protein PilM
MIGVDISDGSIKIVQLSNDEDHTLLAHCWHRVPDGAIERGIVKERNVVRKVVEETLEMCQLRPATTKDAVVASIPESQSFLRVIEVPEMSDDEVDEAIQWEVAQHIPFGLENVYIDWQPVGYGHDTSGNRKEVLVGAAQKQVVDPLINLLNDLGLDVAALELESQAIVRALISAELRKHQGLLVVDLGGSVTNVVIHDHGAMRFTASLQGGAGKLTSVLSAEERNVLSLPRKKDLPTDMAKRVADKLRSGQEELVMEIVGVVEFYNSLDVKHGVREIILTGGGSNFPGLDGVFLRYFENMHVQRGNPWVNVLSVSKAKKPPLSLHESVHFSTALGLALRGVYV